MKETLRVKRLWAMGQFNNIELYDEITEIPEKVALNPQARGLLYKLLILEMERAHKKYLNFYRDNPMLMKVFPANVEDVDEVVAVIETERTRTYNEFLQELNFIQDINKE